MSVRNAMSIRPTADPASVGGAYPVPAAGRHCLAPTGRPGVARSLAATTVCGGAAVLLLMSARASLATGPSTVDALVGVGITLLGALAAAMLALGSALLLTTACARSLGLATAYLDAAAARLTPLLLRRAVAVTVTAGIGLAAGTGTATASSDDLGWTVSTGTEAAVAEAAAETGSRHTAGAGIAPATGTTTPAAVSPGPRTQRAEASASELPGVSATANQTASPDGVSPDRDIHAAAAAPSGPGSDVRAGGTPSAAGQEPTDQAVAAGAASPVASDAPSPVATAPSALAGGPPGSSTPPALPGVTVERGDSLWSIAAAHLPPGADDAAVAAAWPAWYAVNRATLGEGPDLIRPGQVLTVPADAGIPQGSAS
ncbi:MAG: LysM protein [Actinotalea sp.]|nr:LysM protein [Actinotalea sp.]